MFCACCERHVTVWDGLYGCCGDCAECASLEHWDPCCHGACKLPPTRREALLHHQAEFLWSARQQQDRHGDNEQRDLYVGYAMQLRRTRLNEAKGGAA